MLKIFSIRKLMQSTDVNTLDGDNQLHPIFYLHQHFIILGKTYAKFTIIFICSLKQILVFIVILLIELCALTSVFLNLMCLIPNC
jgi:uncharacterized membrane protein YdbT with pleckstrin-like domain